MRVSPEERDLRSYCNTLGSGMVLETLESCERDVFFIITELAQPGQDSEQYWEHSYFAPVILPHHQDVSVLLLSYKWINVKDFDLGYFVQNWGQVR